MDFIASKIYHATPIDIEEQRENKRGRNGGKIEKMKKGEKWIWEKEKERNKNEYFIFTIELQCCVGQFCPVFKLWARKPSPILSPFIQMEQGRARPSTPCEGKRRSEDNHSSNGQNYHPRRIEACWWGIAPCPRTMVSSGPLSEVSGELVNHSE